MTRLPRERKGKTSIDVTITKQGGLPRVRLSMGEANQRGHKNTDMTADEAKDLVTILQFKVAELEGGV